ncbi:MULTISPECIES: STAS domain-containing protein [unclassified Butyrivibrio]|uniref:STAS domain-containing protein n=1 Tax=unclassified Butyrivibrio TaxID=2639466 RepID=UPI0003B323CB|nr:MULTISPECIES: STAS domain-containing protein [unclassified Butyrivibrio]MDC7293977.1 STAS domain-containing protein [Butyrivibrio sp. DSM 10294]
MLNIKKDIVGNTITVALEGILDSQTSPDLDAALMNDLAAAGEVIFDFSSLEYLTSAGLRVILKVQQAMEKAQGRMVIKNVPKDVMDVFNATGFAALLNIE